MGPIPDHCVGPCPIFQSVAVDLFCLIERQGIVNRRQTGKGWGAFFVCKETSAVHVEFVDTYSTHSFLMALRGLMCPKGTPTRIQSDRGDQLVAASKQRKKWDFEGVQRWAEKKGIEWRLALTWGWHFNGQTEKMTGVLKSNSKGVWRAKIIRTRKLELSYRKPSRSSTAGLKRGAYGQKGTVSPQPS
jgi:hypothetical protein